MKNVTFKGRGRKKQVQEIKMASTFAQKEEVKNVARYLSKIGKNDKYHWTQDDTLEYVVQEMLNDREYIKWNSRHFHPDRPYTFNDFSVYFAIEYPTKWVGKTAANWLFPLSVRFDLVWYEKISAFAHSLDVKPGVATRKIVEDFLNSEDYIQRILPGYCRLYELKLNAAQE